MVLIFSANPGTSMSAGPAALNVTSSTVPTKRSCSSSSCSSRKRVWSMSTVCKEGGNQHRMESVCQAGKGHGDAAGKARQRHRKQQARSTMRSTDSSLPSKQVSALKDKCLLELSALPIRDQWFSIVRTARLQVQTASAMSWE